MARCREADINGIGGRLLSLSLYASQAVVLDTGFLMYIPTRLVTPGCLNYESGQEAPEERQPRA